MAAQEAGKGRPGSSCGCLKTGIMELNNLNFPWENEIAAVMDAFLLLVIETDSNFQAGQQVLSFPDQHSLLFKPCVLPFG